MGYQGRYVWRRLAIALVLLLLASAVYSVSFTPESVHAASRQNVVYSGNVKTLKYHAPGCRYYNCKACVKRFNSAAEAEAQGYAACKVCLR